MPLTRRRRRLRSLLILAGLVLPVALLWPVTRDQARLLVLAWCLVGWVAPLLRAQHAGASADGPSLAPPSDPAPIGLYQTVNNRAFR